MTSKFLKKSKVNKKKSVEIPSVKETEPEYAPPDEGSEESDVSDEYSYRPTAGASVLKFAVLAKIVKYMRTRYHRGEDHPISIDEILENTNQLNIVKCVKNWLTDQALVNNPKIRFLRYEGLYNFKPAFNNMKNEKAMMRVLKQYDIKGMGGIFKNDIIDSLPNAEKILQSNASDIITIKRPKDKREVLFYNDKSVNADIDEDFKKLWCTVPMESMDDFKIEEYLKENGVKCIESEEPKAIVKVKAPKKKRLPVNKRDNTHVADILETYENK